MKIVDYLKTVLPIAALLLLGTATGQTSGSAQAPVTAPITVHVGQLIDGQGTPRRDMLITVQGSKIKAIESYGGQAPVTYSLPAMTLLPGLIDTHVHLDSYFGSNGKIANPPGPAAELVLQAYQNAYLDLMGGFTTVQALTSPSVGGAAGIPLRDAIARGEIPGPRIVASFGLIDERSGTPAQIRTQVRNMVAQGADVIKLFAAKSIRELGTQTMTDEQIQAACQEANVLGKRTWVHAQSAASVRAAVLGGCNAIAHGTYATDDEFVLMASHGVFFEPDIGLAGANYMENQARFLGTSNYSPEAFQLQQQAIGLKLAMFKRAILHPDLQIALGTDAVAGCHGRLADEIVYRVKTAGQPVMAALRQATSVAAASLGLQQQIGTVGVGMEADLIAVPGDPLADISVLQRVAFVMKGGKVYKSPSAPH